MPLPLLKSRRIFTVPNQLTILRLGFLPFFVITVKYNHFGWALGILIVAGLSDGLDGVLARTLNQRSELGAYLDPIADKLLLSTSYLVLALKHKLAWWLAILVLGRDMLILVVCAVIIITIGYRPFPPSIFGKATTTFEILLIILVLVSAAWPAPLAAEASRWLGFLVAFLVVFSGVHYTVVFTQQMHSE
jgi:cardiolipin synthase